MHRYAISAVVGSLIGALLLYFIIGCGPKDATEVPEYAYESPAFIDLSDVSTDGLYRYQYVKDQRTGNCYIRAAEAYGIGLAELPCKQVPEK